MIIMTENDTINRQDIIEMLSKSICPTGNPDYDNARESERESILDAVMELPKAEHKQAVCLKDKSFSTWYGKYTACLDCGAMWMASWDSNYCPMCGAELRYKE